MQMSVYINYTKERAVLALLHVMEYIMHHMHEPIVYFFIFKVN